MSQPGRRYKLRSLYNARIEHGWREIIHVPNITDGTVSNCYVGLYMLYARMLCSRWAVNSISASLMVFCHVGRLYTYLRRRQFWTVATVLISVRYKKNTAHVQEIRCSPKGSHLIPWTSAVFSNTALKWTPFASFIPLAGLALTTLKYIYINQGV